MRSIPRPIRVCLASAAACLVLLSACATTPSAAERNARFRMADLDQAVSKAAASLALEASSGFPRVNPGAIKPRTVRAEPMVNLSLDRFSRGEEAMVVARVLSDPRVLESFRTSGIGVLDPEATARTDATHRFVASIRSIAREGASDHQEADARRDTYLLEYQLLDNSTGLITWQHTEEVARLARGLVID